MKTIDLTAERRRLIQAGRAEWQLHISWMTLIVGGFTHAVIEGQTYEITRTGIAESKVSVG